MSELADIGLIGLAVMGQNLVLNMNDKGFVVCVYNRTVSKVDDFLANEAKNTKVIGSHSVEEFIKKLKKPRKIMLLVKAGEVVDKFIEQVIPHIEAGDILIDGGNSEYTDTVRRCKELEARGILFVGSGVSGGEEGARHGPSLMPGGSPKAWPEIKDIFQKISAKVANDEPCCDWVGPGGSGHYVKMVHNGIEYGDMQLISEAYHLMKAYLGLSNAEMSEHFRRANEGRLSSFLIDITADILAFNEDGQYTLDLIRDTAGQKGTGKWTAIIGLENGVPITLIAESVFARVLSSFKDQRVEASRHLSGPSAEKMGSQLTVEEKKSFVEDIMKALYASKIVSYAQGFMMLQEAKKAFSWDINLGQVALMWRGGCIIRSRFLGDIKDAFAKEPNLANLLLAPFFKEAILDCQESWRRVVARACMVGIPVPAFSCALAFYDGIRSERLPANLIQAQRDYFGAHQYELTDKPGTFIHTNWTGKGGTTASSTYQV